jgi:hypothetical protein
LEDFCDKLGYDRKSVNVEKLPLVRWLKENGNFVTRSSKVTG